MTDHFNFMKERFWLLLANSSEENNIVKTSALIRIYPDKSVESNTRLSLPYTLYFHVT